MKLVYWTYFREPILYFTFRYLIFSTLIANIQTHIYMFKYNRPSFLNIQLILSTYIIKCISNLLYNQTNLYIYITL